MNKKSSRKSSLLKGVIIAIILGAFILIFLGAAFTNRNRLMAIYKSGIEAIEEGNYQEGIEILSDLGNYQESLRYIEEANNLIKLDTAIGLFEAEKLEEAQSLFAQLANIEGFSGAEKAAHYVHQIAILIDERERQQKELEKKQRTYSLAQEYLSKKDYYKAFKLFKEIEDYKDSSDLVMQCAKAVQILKLSNTLSAGINASAAITETGEIEFSGKTVLLPSDVEGWKDIVSISIMGSLAIGLRIDGTVCVGGTLPGYYIDTSTWNDIVDVAAGDLYIVGLRKDGTLVAQGHNGDGQVDIADWENIISIDAGWRHTVGLDTKGNVHITGVASSHQLAAIEAHRDDWSDIIAVSAGGSTKEGFGESGHTVALKRDGTAVAVGDNDHGQCNIKSSEWSNLVAISAGAFHTVGLKSNGTVVTTDSATSNELSQWNDIVAISAGYGFTLGLKRDGTVVGAGYDRDGQRITDGWDKIAIRQEWNLIFE